MDKLSSLLESGKPILLDGAMGTMLMDAGLKPGDSPEEWNVLHPDKVRGIPIFTHRKSLIPVIGQEKLFQMKCYIAQPILDCLLD